MQRDEELIGPSDDGLDLLGCRGIDHCASDESILVGHMITVMSVSGRGRSA